MHSGLRPSHIQSRLIQTTGPTPRLSGDESDLIHAQDQFCQPTFPTVLIQLLKQLVRTLSAPGPAGGVLL
jgi:hypothetical protein